ncbi:MAG: HlyD family efflux transporter periplasmic adaptor subunit [Gammaproteobacteria bacterium]
MDRATLKSWLGIQCQMVPGVRRGIVLADPANGSSNEPSASWSDGVRVESAMVEAARRALDKGSAVVEAGSGSPGAQTRVIASPLLVDGQPVGGVALDVVLAGEQHQRAILQLLQWGAMWLRFVSHHEDSAASGRLVTVVNVVASGLEREQFAASASAVVNELSVIVECERVSLGLRERATAKLHALSNSARFSKNAKLVNALEAAMDEAIDQDATLSWSAESNAEGPKDEAHVVRAHAALAAQGTMAACTVPLSHGGRVMGAITLERTQGSPFDSQTIELCEALASILSPILDLKRKQDRPLVVRFRDAVVGAIGRVFGPGYLGVKTTLVALIAIVAFMALAKGDYRITADAQLESLLRRVVVAPRDGFIEAAHVRAGDRVSAGQILGELDRHDLELKHTEQVNQREQLVKEHREVLARRERARMRIVKAQIAQVTARQALVEQQLARSSIAAPFDGVVMRGDLSQNIGSPVELGQVLFEIAPREVNRVVLQVDERDISRVQEGQRGTLTLSAVPSKTLEFVVRKLTPVSDAGAGRNTFRVEAELEQANIPLRPGMQGVGKIQVERRRLLWIWTHRMTDWIRLELWALWP